MSTVTLVYSEGHEAAFHMLLKGHAVAPTWRCRQMTLLHWAAYGGSIECVRSLIDLLFDVNATCANDYVSGDFVVGKGVTPLMLAAQHDHTGVVDVLLTHGAIADYVDTDGMTALLHAIKRDCVACVDILLKHGVHPDGITSVLPHFVDSNLFPSPGLPLSPLMFAIKENGVKSAKALIQANCNFELVYSYSSDEVAVTPFEFALYRRRLPLCRLMLSCGLRPAVSNAAVMQEGMAWMVQEDEAFFTDVMTLLMSAPRLVEIARQTIRQYLGVRVLNALPALPLPGALKQFLMFADVDVQFDG